MFVQSFMWIIGTLIIFSCLWLITKMLTYMFFPETIRCSLRKEIDSLKEKKRKLEKIKYFTNIVEEEIRTEKEIETINDKLKKLNKDLGGLKL